MSGYFACYRTRALYALFTMLLFGRNSVMAALADPTLDRVKETGEIHLGMYLGFEGLSFRLEGSHMGLEVELSRLLGENLSTILETPVKATIVNQEWAQIIKGLRDQNYDAVFSALIPSQLYTPYNISYSESYLDTGPTVCTREINGKATSGITEDPASLAGKRVVVINDPAVRRVMRRSGLYVPAAEGSTDLERTFPISATREELEKIKEGKPLIPLNEVIQLDDMADIYQQLADGSVDAGIIDLGIIWWVAESSPRWKDRIYAFQKPVGAYIYSAVTRAEDKDLAQVLNDAVRAMKEDPRYAAILRKWHGTKEIAWGLKPEDFLQ